MEQVRDRKKTIAVCCATLRELSVLEPIDAICAKANELGMRVQIFQSFEEIDENLDVCGGEESVFDLIDYDNISGVVIFSERIKNDAVIRIIVDNAREHNLPVVSIDREEEGCFNITFDYADAFEQIVRHIIEYHKKKNIFVMAGMENNSFTQERLDVIKQVMEENGLTLRDEDVAYGMFWEHPTKEAMDRFFESGRPLPDAFIAMNDTMATVIIDELQKRGYRVPQDVVVTGFDGIYLSEYCVPKITTAKQQLQRAGEKAVEIIEDYLDRKCVECYDTAVPFKMHIRQSCGCRTSMEMNGYVGNLREMYSNFEGSKRFSGYMDEMTRRIVANTCFENFSAEAKGYSFFLENQNVILLSVTKSFLKTDAAYYEKVCREHPELREPSDKNMIVLVEGGNNSGPSMLMRDFARKELLPDYDKFMEITPNIIIVPVHSGFNIYGHMVTNYVPHNIEAYKNKVYVNKLSNILYVIEQHINIQNSNMELIRTKNELEKMYITDPMTGINNRRGFYQKFNDIPEASKIGILTVISVDLDDLKEINDTYGHQEGDFSIKALASALSEEVGDGGYYARFGGDEFVGLVMDSKRDKSITENLYRKISERLKEKSRAAKKPYEVRCSLGAVQASWEKVDDIEKMIKKSDKLLYEMKKAHHSGCYDTEA